MFAHKPFKSIAICLGITYEEFQYERLLHY